MTTILVTGIGICLWAKYGMYLQERERRARLLLRQMEFDILGPPQEIPSIPIEVQCLIMDKISDRQTFNNARLVNKAWAINMRRSHFYRSDLFKEKYSAEISNQDSLSNNLSWSEVVFNQVGNYDTGFTAVSLGVITDRVPLENLYSYETEMLSVVVPGRDVSFDTVLTSYIDTEHEVVTSIVADNLPMHNALLDRIGPYNLDIVSRNGVDVLEASSLPWYCPTQLSIGITVGVETGIGIYRLYNIYNSEISKEEKNKMTKKVVKQTGCNIVGSLGGAMIAGTILLMCVPGAGPLLIIVAATSGRIVGRWALNKIIF